MTRPGRILVVSLLASLVVLLAPRPGACAWDARTRVRMLDEAVRFMPGSLRLALERRREALLRGALTPLTDENGPAHRPPWAQGTLDAEIERAARRLGEGLAERTPFDELAVRFGYLAHFVLDAGFPPGMTDGDGAARYEHFAEFCESRRGKFPLVFYGHQQPELAAGDVRGFALAVMQRARDEDRQLARAYAAAGDPPDPAAFDDRSIPFAVASLAYSRSVNDVVRIWLDLWEHAGGDVTYTPYREPDRSEPPREGG
jgi:hypothetical protein